MAIVNWNKAPEGAEFYSCGNFYKHDRGLKWFSSLAKEWSYSIYTLDKLSKRRDYCERPQQWPETDERIDVIGTNGNTAEHYAQAKHDGDKPRYDLLPPVAIDMMAQVMTFGAKKYKPEGWRTVPDAVQRYQAALLRHSFAMLRGEVLDTESGLPHAAHAMCCAAFLAELHSSDH